MKQSGNSLILHRPLEIRVFWDPGFEKGFDYAGLIFQHFSKSEDISVEYNIGIPVYFLNSPIIDSVDFKSKTNICFIFVDDNFILNKNRWKQTIDFLSDTKTQNNIHTIPVKFSEHACRTFDEFSLMNFIIPEDKTKNDKFLLAVAYSIYACLFNDDKQEKITVPLFLSHYKKSAGATICRNIINYISNSRSPIKVFFDENDIDYGARFDITIENNIKKSTLVIIHTDGFSNREFCKREVLSAKQYERPIVLIDFLQKGENRSFPYLGNIKTMKIEKNINYFKLIFEILKESIRIEYFKKKNESIIAYFNPPKANYKIIPYAPELLTMSYRKEAKETIVYPNPVLGNEEIRILRSQFPRKIFTTPILFVTSSKNYFSMLKDISVSFSVSETDEMRQAPDIMFRSREVLTSISRYLIACGAKIIYSGNLNYQKFNFLEVLLIQFSSYKEWLNDGHKISTSFFDYIYIDLYDSISKGKLAEISNAGSVISIEAVKTRFSDEINKALSFSKLREEVSKNVCVSIFIGGKTNEFVGIMPGVLEEFIKAVEHKNAIYLIGAFGGISSAIIDLILGKQSDIISNSNLITNKEAFYSELLMFRKEAGLDKLNFDKIAHEIGKITMSNLRNGLTKDENLILFKTDDPDQISSLILKGLRNRTISIKKQKKESTSTSDPFTRL